jgi:Cdc6-like AAA superfamily ATPase
MEDERKERKTLFLDRIIRRILKQKPLFQDERYLTNSITSEILPRKNIIEGISVIYSELLQRTHSGGIHTIIYGESGTGKTTIIKWFFSKLIQIAQKNDRELKTIYLNCRIHKSHIQLLNSILRNLDNSFPTRGFGSDEMLQYLVGMLTQKPLKVILILDECDSFLQDNWDLLLDIIRLNEEYAVHSGISIICVIKNIDLIKKMPHPLSIYFQKSFHFTPYTHRELFHILKLKCEKAFCENVISDDLIQFTIDLLGDKKDLRLYMQIIWKAGKIAQTKNQLYISREDLKRAYNEIQQFTIKEVSP